MCSYFVCCKRSLIDVRIPPTAWLSGLRIVFLQACGDWKNVDSQMWCVSWCAYRIDKREAQINATDIKRFRCLRNLYLSWNPIFWGGSTFFFKLSFTGECFVFIRLIMKMNECIAVTSWLQWWSIITAAAYNNTSVKPKLILVTKSKISAAKW